MGIEYFAAALVIAALAAFVVRMWRGDHIEIGPLKIERPGIVPGLKTSLEALSRDDRLKANVLWMFRERLNEANRIITDGIEEPAVRAWCRGVLTDIITALSEGGHDRHRASRASAHRPGVDHEVLHPGLIAAKFFRALSGGKRPHGFRDLVEKSQ